MKDDDFSGIVRSGAHHSVSVSEHTGNAKTPKNIVTSHAEETEKRKLAFEQHELDALDVENLIADDAQANLLAIPGAGTAKGNVQKVTIGKGAENIQSLTPDNLTTNRQQIGEGTASPNIQAVNSGKGIESNRQDVPVGAIAANIQEITADSVMAANVQNVSVDAIAANHQTIGIEVNATNRQAIAAEKGIEANTQSIPLDAIVANTQKIDSHAITTNKQNTTADKAIDANRQNIPTDVVAKNLQDVPIGHVLTNQQALDSNATIANQQALPEEATTQNQQTLETEPVHGANLQAIPKDETDLNHQTISEDSGSPNDQGIANDQHPANDQRMTPLAQGSHKQTLDEVNADINRQPLAAGSSIPPNHQAIVADASILNRQAAPEDGPPGLNRQAVDNGKIEDHYEPLPSEKIDRASVDFSSAVDGKNASAGTPTLPQTKVVRAPARNTAARAALSPEELQAIKLKREKMMDEFHGRVAGIKHNVEALNERLTDFEEQVHKEDAQLLKGNPDHFKVDLG